MKKNLFFSTLFKLAIFVLPFMTTAQTPCDLRIISEFDSDCPLTEYWKANLLMTDPPPIDCILACQGNTVNYRAECSGRGTFSWNISGASNYNISSDGSTAIVTWGHTSSGHITVTFISSNNDSTCIAELCVLLMESPTVGCTTVPSYYIDEDGNKVVEVCLGEDVEFIDHSDGNNSIITGYMWDCPNWNYRDGTNFGTYSTPNCTYHTTQTGNYVVEHSVMNLCGCEDREKIILRVLESTDLQLSCYGTVCANSTAEYFVQSPSCSEYHWIVEGGSIVDGLNTNTVTVNWDNPSCGYGTLSLDAFFCNTDCNSIATVKIPIIGDNLEVSGPEEVCVGDVQKYGVPRFGSTYYNWQVVPMTGLDILPDKSPNNCLLRFNQPGDYEFYAEYGCDFLGCGPYKTMTKHVVVRDTLCIHSDHTICAGDTGIFTTNCPSSVNWEILDSAGRSIYSLFAHSISYSFEEGGSYQVSASHPDFCKNADFALTVLDAPPALIITEGPHVICPGSSALFSATPTRPDYYLEWRPIRNTAFPFVVEGDEATFTFASVCNINVYQVDRQYGCRSEAFVHTLASFQLAPFNRDTISVCAGATSLMEVADQLENVTYKWTVEPQALASILGDNRQPSVTILFNGTSEDSTYARIRLKRIFCSGIEVEEEKIILITQTAIPILSFNHDVCQNDTVILSAEGMTMNDDDYRWVVNGTTLTGRTVSFVFENPGVYPLTMYYTSHNGCLPAEVADTLNVSNMPDVTVALDFSNNDRTLSVPLQDDVTYNWIVNGSPIGTANSIDISNDFTGSVCCTVTSTISPNCSAQKCMNLTEQVTHQSQDDDPTEPLAASLSVNCNEVTILSGQTAIWTIYPTMPENICSPSNSSDSVTVHFSLPGNYSINGYCFSNDTHYEYRNDITILCVPKFKLRYDCSGNLIIEDQSLYLDGFLPIRHYQIFVNGTSRYQIDSAAATEQLDLSAYLPAQVRIVATIDSVNCTFEESVNILERLTITDIDVSSTVCENTPFLFSASTTGAVAQFRWDFGDNSFNLGNNIYHSYGFDENTINPVVTLIVTDSLGCADTLTETVSVMENTLEAQHTLNATPSDALCPGDVVTLEYNTNRDDNIRYYWNFSPNAIVSNTYYAYHTGIYRVRAVDELSGCVDEKMKNVKFDNAPNARITGRTQFCLGDEVTLYGNTGSSYNYQWQVTGPENHTSTTPNIRFTPNMSGTYLAVLTVESASSCISATRFMFEVDTPPAAPQIALVSGNYSLIAPPVPAYSVNGTILEWSNGFRGLRADFYNDGYITAHYMDPVTGCKSDKSSLFIPPAPDFDALLTGCYRVCSEKLPLTMPVYNLFPIDNPSPFNPYLYPAYWLTFWYPTAQIFGESPLFLPINNYGEYQLDFWVDNLWRGSSDLVNGQFVNSLSSILRIEEVEVCPCENVDVKVLKNECFVTEECGLDFFISIEITNTRQTDNLSIEDIRCCAGGSIYGVSSLPLDILPGQTRSLDFYYTGVPLNVSEIEFSLWEGKHPCEQRFRVKLDWRECVTECDYPIEEFSWGFVPEISTPHQTIYFDIHAYLPEWTQTLLGFWCEPFQLSDALYMAPSEYNSLLNIDYGRLTQMAANDEEICFYIVACSDGQICVAKICLSAQDVLEQVWTDFRSLPVNKQESDDGDADFAPPVPNLFLVPNPAWNEVVVSGINIEDVDRIYVLTMNGKVASSFCGCNRFNVSTLSRATYIVCVRTKNGQAHYLKLVKE